MVYSTLSGLPETVIPELMTVGARASTLMHLIKPFQYGIQFSHTRHFNKYMSFLRTSGVYTFERIGTSDSLVPNRVGMSSTIYGGEAFEIKAMSASIFTEGS